MMLTKKVDAVVVIIQYLLDNSVKRMIKKYRDEVTPKVLEMLSL